MANKKKTSISDKKATTQGTLSESKIVKQTQKTTKAKDDKQSALAKKKHNPNPITEKKVKVEKVECYPTYPHYITTDECSCGCEMAGCGCTDPWYKRVWNNFKHTFGF